jgi:hypothetical protein
MNNPVLADDNPHGSPVAEPYPADVSGQSNRGGNVKSKVAQRKDKRPTLTYKGDEFGPEFRALVNKAAARSGMSQAAFVAETLRLEAQRILKGTPADTPAEASKLPVVHAERLDAQERAIVDLADQVRRLVELQTTAQRASLWARLRGSFGGEPRVLQPVQRAA